jgi:hypothetical protein
MSVEIWGLGLAILVVVLGAAAIWRSLARR